MSLSFALQSSLPLPLYAATLHQYSSAKSTLRHFHLQTDAAQRSFLLAIPFGLATNNGIAHVMEHMLLAGNHADDTSHRFFELQAGSTAVAINATTCSRYMALHFTVENVDEYVGLAKQFVQLINAPQFCQRQFEIEVGASAKDCNHPGVVVNEMRQHFSAPIWLLSIAAFNKLYDSGPKSFNAGGKPELIAALRLQELVEFWDKRMLHAQTCIISQGDIEPAVLHPLLSALTDSCQSADSANLHLSTAIKTAKEFHLQTPQSQPALVTVALLVGNTASTRSKLEAALLQSLLSHNQYPLQQILLDLGIKLLVAPHIANNENDRILLFIAEGADTAKVEQALFEALATLVAKLKPAQLLALTESAISHYLITGNKIFSAGVDLSMRVLESMVLGGTKPDEFDAQIEFETYAKQFAQKQNWQQLIKRLLTCNHKKVIIYSTPNKAAPNSRPNRNAVKQMALPLNRQPAPLTIRQTPFIDNLADSENQLIERQHAGRLHHYPLPELAVSIMHIVLPVASPNHSPEMTEQRCQVLANYTEALKIRQPGLSERLVISAVTNQFYSVYLDVAVACFWQNLAAVAIDMIETYRNPEWLNSKPVKQHRIKAEPMGLHVKLMALTASSLSRTADTRVKLSQVAGLEFDCHAQNQTMNHIRLAQSSDCFAICGIGAKKIDATLARLCQSEWLADLRTAPDSMELPMHSINNVAPIKIPIPGAVNHCARVWQLPANFGNDAKHDVVFYLVAALATTVFLEPLIRQHGGAYATAAEVRPALGILGMYSFGDSELEKTDQVFKNAMQQILGQNYPEFEFHRARYRAIGRLAYRGSMQDRCFQQFKQWLFGATESYHKCLLYNLATISHQRFQVLLNALFSGLQTNYGVFAGEQCA